MKTIHVFPLLVFLLTLWACQSETTTQKTATPETADTEPAATGGYKDTISLSTANEWVCNFKSYMEAGVSTQQWDSIKADGFLVPEIDLTELMDEPGVENVRIYLGLRTDGPADTMKLVLVGVDSAGNDMLSLIADMTVPCPPDCGTVNDIRNCPK